MIQSENNSSKKIKENKYKILRMSLLLGTDTDKEETINNFEDAAREIDFMNNETYLSELESKFYDTKTLEEESKKLTELVDYIAGRLSQRESLISDFINVTGRNLTGLEEIKYENKLIDYQDRLKYINEYLDNSRKIEEETDRLEKLKARLKEEEYQKDKNEQKNEELENLLRKKFISAVSNKIDLNSLDENNIEDKINELFPQMEESRKSLDIFTKSFETLRNAGLNYDEEMEYKSYVTGARDVYYDTKEQEYLLNIYKLLLSSETEYSKIFNKREYLNNLLNDRLDLRHDLEIKEPDCLESIYNILNHQTQIVEGQKDNIDNIAEITAKIKYSEERIEELNDENSKVEILSILKEYNIIDTYEEETQEIEISPTEPIPTPDYFPPSPEETPEQPSNELDLEIPELDFPTLEQVEEIPIETQESIIPPQEENVTHEPEPQAEIPINKPYKNNFVMGSHDPVGLNVEKCVEKATNVMRRVGKMLNIVSKDETIATPPIQEEVPTISPQQPEPITQSPFLNTEVTTSPFLNQPEEPQEIVEPSTNTEQSNVKNVLPTAEDFWNNSNDSDEDADDFPELTVSNDNFFANNMDNFEFPNLDEFK